MGIHVTSLLWGPKIPNGQMLITSEGKGLSQFKFDITCMYVTEDNVSEIRIC